MADSIRVVLDFCDVMVKLDAEALQQFLAADAVYQNTVEPAVIGAAAIVENLAAQFSAFPDSYEYKVLNAAESDGVVLTERRDTIRISAGVLHGVPVMGAFEMCDGKISRWTDWDPSLVAKMMSGEDVGALVPAGT